MRNEFTAVSYGEAVRAATGDVVDSELEGIYSAMKKSLQSKSPSYAVSVNGRISEAARKVLEADGFLVQSKGGSDMRNLVDPVYTLISVPESLR